MRVAVLFGWMVSVALASACGGQVVVDGAGSHGGGGDGGGDAGGGKAEGGAASCTVVACTNEGTSSCACQTDCLGPDLRADCHAQETGEIVCECHYDGAYMGLCSALSGSVCGLPGGCCYGYLP